MKYTEYKYYKTYLYDPNHSFDRSCNRSIDEYRTLTKYDKIIEILSPIKWIDFCMLPRFHAEILINGRYFVIDEDIDNTFHFQENMDDGDIIYILDGCIKPVSFAKRVLKYINEL